MKIFRLIQSKLFIIQFRSQINPTSATKETFIRDRGDKNTCSGVNFVCRRPGATLANPRSYSNNEIICCQLRYTIKLEWSKKYCVIEAKTCLFIVDRGVITPLWHSTAHSEASRLTHPYKYILTPPVMCSQQVPLLHLMNN